MTNTKRHTEGDLPKAKTRLDKAITQLFDPITATINNTHVEAPSLYGQLCDAIFGQTGERSGGAAGSPLWIDACDLRNQIDVQLAHWQPRGIDAVDRVHHIDVRPWRPQDTDLVDCIATTMDTWATSITNLLNPEARVTIPAACPSCGVRTVYRESAGEQVRQPALQVTKDGCQCMNRKCGATWTPDLYMHLSRVLGFKKPDGVLE